MKLRGTPMPDSPAHNSDFLRKISLDPGTERLATKKELIGLLEKGETETPKAPSRISTSVEKSESTKNSASVNSTAEKTVTSVAPKTAATDLAEIETETPARPMPILQNSNDAETIHIDLVELAAILDQHKIWVESGGDEGTKADLSGVNLENADLTGVNLQGAVLQRANLRNADLAMANLKGATLVQADLCNANLLGAELRGANLMGATLYGAEGLWLGRLGGANLYDAMLPETISSIDGAKTVWETTKSARWFYFLMLTVCTLCGLGVATTSDARLILDGQ